jgi:hypothetical protein
MWTGRRFRLRKHILGIELIEGERRALYIPKNEMVRVVSGPKLTAVRLAEVEWQHRHFSVFVVDLENRADEISEQGSAPRPSIPPDPTRDR